MKLLRKFFLTSITIKDIYIYIYSLAYTFKECPIEVKSAIKDKIDKLAMGILRRTSSLPVGGGRGIYAS